MKDYIIPTTFKHILVKVIVVVTVVASVVKSENNILK